MPSLLAQLAQVFELGTPVALPEGMNIVQIIDDDGCSGGEVITLEAAKEALGDDLTVNVRHAHFDAADKEEVATILGNLYGSRLPRPRIDILKEVVVDGLKMGQVELTTGSALLNPDIRELAFDPVEDRGVPDVEFVLEDAGARIDVGSSSLNG